MMASPSNPRAQQKLNLSLPEEDDTSDNIGVDLDALRNVVTSSLLNNMYDNATFFCNKLVTLSGAHLPDVFLLARAYFLGKQFRRAVHVMEFHGLLDNMNVVSDDSDLDSLHYFHLAAQCWIECGKSEEAQNILETLLGERTFEQLQQVSETMSLKRATIFAVASSSASAKSVNIVAALCNLRGKVYEIMENRVRSVLWYKAALYCDINCYEAFGALVDNQLKPAEELSLIEDLRSAGAFEDPSDKWLEAVYLNRMSKHDYSDTFSTKNDAKMSRITKRNDPAGPNLENDVGCISSKATRLYYQNDAQSAYQLTHWVRQRDPFQLESALVYVATMVELKKTSELFYCAHQLVDAYPKKAVSWYAVGCYYYSIGKFDAARRYFHKATTLDSHMAPAWLGFGHSFAAQDESDQAMAAYRTASRLFIGSHLPVLFTAIEYLRTNNVTLAEQFCVQAKKMCPTDPLVMNELGIVHYRQKRYKYAVEYFKEALKLCQNQPQRLMAAWEPSIFNLGHALRKLRRYEEAIQYYGIALGYAPREASTYAALGLTYHLMGKLEDAIQNYHKALGLKPEDTFASEMLDKALVQSYDQIQIGTDPENPWS